MRVGGLLAFAVGPIVTAALALITVPLTAWVFSPDDIGRFNVFTVTLSLLLLVSLLGLDQAYVREYHEAPDKGLLLRTCMLPGFVLAVAASTASLWFAKPLSQLLYGFESRLAIAATALALILTYCSRFLSLVLRMQERGLGFSMSQILPKFVQIALIVVLAYVVKRTTFAGLLAISIASLFVVLLVLGWTTKQDWMAAIRARIQCTYLVSIVGFGAPLILSSVAYWALTATSTFALRSLSTLSELAVYSVAASFAGAAAILQSIFSVVWAPTVYKWAADGADMTRIDRVTGQLLAIVCVVVILFGIFAPAVDFLLPERYAEVKYVLICSVLQPLLYTLSESTSMGIAMSRRTMWSMWVTLAAMCVNVLCSIALVPRFGAAGAAAGNALAFGAFFVGRTEASARLWRVFPRLKLYVTVAVVCSFCVTTTLFARISPLGFSLAWAALLPLALIAFRSELQNVGQTLASARPLRRLA
jgi:O-antigen/teichoic acid export membrane protein